jgi:hypothetical protein
MLFILAIYVRFDPRIITFHSIFLLLRIDKCIRNFVSQTINVAERLNGDGFWVLVAEVMVVAVELAAEGRSVP